MSDATQHDGLAAAIVRARALVAARGPRLDELSAIRCAPDDLASLDVDGDGVVKLIEIRSLRAVQPYVFRDLGRLARPDPSLEELAEVTLPRSAKLVPTIEQAAPGTLRVTSRSQNLQVLGDFAGPLPGGQPGVIGVGFLVGVAPSQVRVRVVDSKVILVDGYHRCVALLAAGIEVVPALVVSDEASDARWSDGTLSEHVVLGERAPYVADYLDDDVSVEVTLRHIGRQTVVRVEESDLFPSEPPRASLTR